MRITFKLELFYLINEQLIRLYRTHQINHLHSIFCRWLVADFYCPNFVEINISVYFYNLPTKHLVQQPFLQKFWGKASPSPGSQSACRLAKGVEPSRRSSLRSQILSGTWPTKLLRCNNSSSVEWGKMIYCEEIRPIKRKARTIHKQNEFTHGYSSRSCCLLFLVYFHRANYHLSKDQQGCYCHRSWREDSLWVDCC